MNEPERLARNAQKVAECYPVFRARLQTVIADVEAAGYHPRIQEAWRSPQDQQTAYETGHSKLRFGLHNVTGANRTTESLAADVLDDDHPLNAATAYLLALAIAARDHDLETGILWGLPSGLAGGVNDAVARRDTAAAVKVGWDPTHVQVIGITATAAKGGARPT